MGAADDHVARLRAAVGHAPLWLLSVTGVVIDADASRTLLVRRPETGLWAPVAAVLGPGEEPAPAIERAVHAEAGTHATVEQLAWVHVTRPLRYANGDRAQYLNLVFRLRVEQATDAPEPATARWFPLDGLPPDLGADHRERIDAALAPDRATRFARPPLR
ncbi:putative MutT/NUDIX-family protein [Agromyces rhizosphaerae]|uniref:MutT/NUDIX-family protein n=1 Tax=Agromyces rhizosphaerae TaxID=88374 RepID=A0A9W6CYH7_9MICO|nr:NUDIX domain-containing protein [Agromyces rhizosphaerae]GLI29007.1 putative MutT/NUDIX-family protein [Agromyces rhizosphaerae]